MKWILCGKNAAAAAALEFLVERGDDVFSIGTAGDDGTDGWQRSLVGTARRLGVRCEQPRRINDASFAAALGEFGAAALLSIQYDQILRAGLFDAVGAPCLNFHFALLPRHRGVSPIAFAILMGDDEAGVTLHHMVEEIDAGDVIAQRAVPIGGADSARALYDRVSDAAVSLFRDSYPFDAPLTATAVVQDGRAASYHRQGDFDFAARDVDWHQPVAELQRWLRAMIFPPFQYPETALGSRCLRIERVAAEIVTAPGAAPGTVVASSPEGLDVAARGGAVRITQLSGPDGRPQDVTAISVGDQLVSAPAGGARR